MGLNAAGNKRFVAVLPDGREVVVHAVSAWAAGITVMQVLGAEFEPRTVVERAS